jgi:uncharacterized membrane protein
MRETSSTWSDQRVEQLLGILLRTGVSIAAAVVGLGAIVYLWRHGHERPAFGVFHGEPDDARTVSGILHSALTGHGRGLIQLGLLLLIATPVARIAFSLVAFVRQRDRLYVAITSLVLAMLLFGLFGPAI